MRTIKDWLTLGALTALWGVLSATANVSTWIIRRALRLVFRLVS